MAKLVLKGGRVIDPAANIDHKLDILIEGEQIVETGESLSADDVESIDCSGKTITPGLIDLRAELREPGNEESETIETGAKAAAKGGFTSILCMPNTDPVMDNAGTIEHVKEIARRQPWCKVLPAGAVSKKREGTDLADIGEMSERGIRCITDADRSILNAKLMRRAMEYAATFNVLVMSHCEDTTLSKNGTANEGIMTARLGYRVMPTVAEESIVYRDIRLSEYLDLPLHISRISSTESVNLIRMAKNRGAKITCGVGIHHLILNEESLGEFDTNFKSNPPLRREEDRVALVEALADGTIDVLVSDHQPYHVDYKDCEFDIAAFGISSLETCLGLALDKLVHAGHVTMNRLVETMSTNPGRLIADQSPTLTPGSTADISIIDTEKKWTVEPKKFESLGKNSPYAEWDLKGTAHGTIVNGSKTM